jgi:hypothetical protein
MFYALVSTVHSQLYGIVTSTFLIQPAKFQRKSSKILIIKPSKVPLKSESLILCDIGIFGVKNIMASHFSTCQNMLFFLINITYGF